MKSKLFALVLLPLAGATVYAQSPAPESKPAKPPGVPQVQVPFANLKPLATFKVGEAADWVLITADSVWVAGAKPDSVERINPSDNSVVAKISLPGEACSGLEFGFGSLWVPICGDHPLLVRIDAASNKITATLPIGPAGPEGGIAANADSIWLVPDKQSTLARIDNWVATKKQGTLARIDPVSEKVRQQIAIPAGSYNPIFAEGFIWISGVESNTLTAVDAASGKIVATIPVGRKPRFLTAGAGSIWTLNQGDGSISRVDAARKTLTATIKVGIPGQGGDICFGADSVWATVFDIPLSRIDSKTNKVVRQWVGTGGDSMRVGFDSVWLTDYRKGLLWRFSLKDALAH